MASHLRTPGVLGPRAGRGGSFHARVVEGVKPFKTVDIHDSPKVIFPSGQPCLEEKMTFGDPFEDSGVVVAPPILSLVKELVPGTHYKTSSSSSLLSA